LWRHYYVISYCAMCLCVRFSVLIVLIKRRWWFLQGVSIACYASHVLATIGMSACPSVTRWHWVKTTQARITKFSPTDSPMTLVFGIKRSSRNSTGFAPSEGDKWEWGRKNSQFSANKSPIEPNLLLMINRKLHTSFRLVPKSTTLERPIRTLLQKRWYFGAHHKNLNEDRPIQSAAKM